jgi:hypothetical protein
VVEPCVCALSGDAKDVGDVLPCDGGVLVSVGDSLVQGVARMVEFVVGNCDLVQESCLFGLVSVACVFELVVGNFDLTQQGCLVGHSVKDTLTGDGRA